MQEKTKARLVISSDFILKYLDKMVISDIRIRHINKKSTDKSVDFFILIRFSPAHVRGKSR